MTWSEWISSTYNTQGYENYWGDISRVYGGEEYVIKYAHYEEHVNPSEVIEANHTYYELNNGPI